jgi:hypothetical protein
LDYLIIVCEVCRKTGILPANPISLSESKESAQSLSAGIQYNIGRNRVPRSQGRLSPLLQRIEGIHFQVLITLILETDSQVLCPIIGYIGHVTEDIGTVVGDWDKGLKRIQYLVAPPGA